MRFDKICEIKKYNHNHDSRGRFCSASGGVGFSGMTSMLFNRKHFQEISQASKGIIEEDYEHETFGIRVQDKDTETIGEEMTHRSKNFGGDFEDIEEMQDRNGEELDGVSTIGIGNEGQVTEFGGYEGKVAYLIGGSDYDVGYDPGEKIIKDPVVLAKFGYKDGKLVVIDKVKTEQNEQKESPKKQTDSEPTPNKEYTDFMAQMERKYGADRMYREMSDAEFDKYQHLEMHRFDKSAVHYDYISEVGERNK